MRVISWFSCGAASAAATVLAKAKYGEIEAVYCRVKEEHPDNLRFLYDFQKVTGIQVETIMNEKYDGSIYNVFRGRKFIKGTKGAPCTTVLKKDMRKAYQRSNDIQIFGYTAEETDRADKFIDANNDVNEDFQLIENNVSKLDCLQTLGAWGVAIPVMYRLGYNNNNCIGCVKGGMGYWNKVRRDFPLVFKRMADMEREIGHSVNKDDHGPVYLDTLDPSRGRFETDMPGDCGFSCEYTS